MIKVTTWSPDTCGCTVSYQWDDSVPQDSRVHSFHSIQNKCPAHQGLSDQQVYDALFDENPRKNHTLEIFRANFSKLTRLLPDGTSEIDFSKISWQFNASRVLEITVPSLTPAEKVTVNQLIVNRFGTGKVVII